MSHAPKYVVILSAALLALLAGPRTRAAEPRDDLKFLPADSNLLVNVKVAELLGSDLYKKLKKETPMLEKQFEGTFRKEFGFELANVERLIFGGNVKGGQPIALFRLKNAVKAETIVKAHSAPRFEGDKGTVYKQEKVGAFTVYVGDQEFRDSFCFLDDMTFVFGKPKDLKEALERNKRADFTTAFQAALKSVDATATVNFAFDPKPVLAMMVPPIPGVDFGKVRDAINGTNTSIKIGKEVSFRIMAVCKDDKAAEEIKMQAEALRTFLIAEAKKAPANEVPKEVLELPGMVKLATKGNQAEATLTLKEDAALAFIKAAGLGRMVGAPPSEKVKPPAEKKPWAWKHVGAR